MPTTVFFLLLPILSSATALPLQLLALLSLRSSLLDPLSTLTSWSGPIPSISSPSPPWCLWSGITCNSTTGDITAINLPHRNLSGLIAPEISLLYRTLRYLNLSNNAFEGPLPPAIFDLSHLETLDISHNNFNSTFPPTISNLRSLSHLDAYSNSYTGTLPTTLSNLRNLKHINLGGSYFTGSIPLELFTLPSLRYLHLAGNLLTGTLPHQLGSLSNLEHLEIGYNAYHGSVPVDFRKLSNLRYLDISAANLSGTLPSEIDNLTRLESLFLFNNHISGHIPETFSNLKTLKVLDLSDNHLSGEIPCGFSNLVNLTVLSLMNNELTGQIPQGMGDISALESLLLWNNSLNGSLPIKLGTTGRLMKLDVSTNRLSGPVPPGLCTGNRLVRLILFDNQFNSELPPGLANCSSLWRIRIQNNQFTGWIPSGFGFLPNLTYLDLSSNNFNGALPPDLGAAPRLELLNVSGNPLTSALPDNIWNAPSLQVFSASNCSLRGEIPSFGDGGCRNLYRIEMGENELSGRIPSDIGHSCQKLVSLKLERNRLSGTIPPELAALQSITEVDLSYNDLSGSIPMEFDNCRMLESLNVSFNHLEGAIPVTSDVLQNLPPSSFAGNAALCGAPAGRPCRLKDRADGHADPGQPSAGATIVWIIAAATGAVLLVLIAGTHWTQISEEDLGPGPWRLMAFQKLNFTADDVVDCVSTTDNVIGIGSTGTVHRGEMPSGEVVAVKKLWGRQQKVGQIKKGGATTEAEVEVLRSVRHRNIVRLLGCCSNRVTTLLLYEYMPNGNLDDMLHQQHVGKGVTLDWVSRYQIAVGIAQGICYLHHDCNPVILHRDLKPSNILLDGDMEARVADFGVAKLIPTGKHSMSVVAGSYGYIAPEYAYTLQVDDKSDVYSYGVVLMELVSGTRPVEVKFGEGNNIVDWVRWNLMKGTREGTREVLDPAVWSGCSEVREEMLMVLRVALLCTSQKPGHRPSMRDVLSMLQEAKPHRKATKAATMLPQGDCRSPVTVEKPVGAD